MEHDSLYAGARCVVLALGALVCRWRGDGELNQSAVRGSARPEMHFELTSTHEESKISKRCLCDLKVVSIMVKLFKFRYVNSPPVAAQFSAPQTTTAFVVRQQGLTAFYVNSHLEFL